MYAARLKSELFIAFEEATAFTRRALNMFRARARHDSEISLQLLLTSSPDPIVLIDGAHRFVDANTKALDLFGISKSNVMKFTLDTFLSYKAIAKCDRYRSAFVKRPEKHGKCEIIRLKEVCYPQSIFTFRILSGSAIYSDSVKLIHLWAHQG